MPHRNDQKVNINTANAADLQRIEGIDGQRARLIIEYREAHGPFKNWDEVENVAGVGDILSDKVRGSATFGDQPPVQDAAAQDVAAQDVAAQDVAAQDGAAFDADGSSLDSQEEGEEEIADEEMDALAALARLDLEAAEAYDVAADSIDDPDLLRTLRQFRGDHLRHFERINAVLSDRGFEPLEAEVDPDSVFLSLVETIGAMGPDAALLAMISSEQLTNATYESALMLGFDDEVAAVIEQNYDDEKRHLDTLRALHRKTEARGASRSDLQADDSSP